MAGKVGRPRKPVDSAAAIIDWMDGATEHPRIQRAPRVPAAGTKGDQVRKYLLSHYPCAVLPLGVLSEVGERFGMTRERVRQIAVAIGYPGYNSLPKDQRIIRGKMGRKLCPSCGKAFGKAQYAEDRVAGIRCPDCRWTDVACSECGKLKRVRTSEYLWRMNRSTNKGVYTGAQFCDRACLGIYVAKHYGFIAHPENTGTDSGAPRKARTRDKVIAALTHPMTYKEIVAALGLRKSNAVDRVLKELLAEGRATYVIGNGAGSPRIWSLVEPQQ